jgi:S1-C subfamily serine protease
VAAIIIAGLIGVALGTWSYTSRVQSISATATVPSGALPTSPTFPTPPSTGSGSGGSSGGTASGQQSSIAAKVKPGVVAINTKLGYQSASAAGTGMVLTGSGEVLTNNHVIDGATTITATVVSTGRTYSADVLGTDPTADIALIQLKGAHQLKTVATGNSSSVVAGDPVVAIGNAGGRGVLDVVSGTVDAVGQSITASDQSGANAERLTNLIRHTAPIESGDSGGPLVNKAGQVIGMDSAASAGMRFESSNNVGFAIPITDALAVVHQIEGGQASDTIHLGWPPFLGVQVVPAGGSSFDDGSGSSTSTSGAVVAGVEPGTPAASTGISQGDTVTSVNGQSVDSPQALTDLLRRHHPGDKVTIGWVDSSGSSHTAKVKLTTGPAD